MAINRFKYILNYSLFLATLLGLFGLCYLVAGLVFYNCLSELVSNQLWDLSISLIAVGAVHIVVGTSLAFGSIERNMYALFVYVVTLSVIAATELIILRLALIPWSLMGEQLKRNTNDLFNDYKKNYRIVADIQQMFDCCGLNNYSRINTSPFCKLYPERGCLDQVQNLFTVLLELSVGIALLELLLGLISAVVLFRTLKDISREMFSITPTAVIKELKDLNKKKYLKVPIGKINT